MESIPLTDDNGLRLALDSDPSARAGGHLHSIDHAHLQPAHHHGANGRVHRLIHVETRLVSKTPDLKGQDGGGGEKKDKEEVNSIKASSKLNKAAAGLAGTDLVLLDDAVLVLQWGRVPGDADGSAVLVSYGQDRYLLGGSAGSCRRKNKRKQVNKSSALYCALQE